MKVNLPVEKRRKKNKGFTLVELMVVLTILLILSTLAVVTFGGVMDSARESAQMADAGILVRQINTFNSLARPEAQITNHEDVRNLINERGVVSLNLVSGPYPQGNSEIDFELGVSISPDRFNEILTNDGPRIVPPGDGLLWTVANDN